MTDDVTLSEWPNRSGKLIRVRLCEYHGKIRVDIREFYKRDGEFCPTRRGIGVDPDRLRQLGRAVRRARVLAMKRKT
jgi:hypothetical protein